MNRENELMVIGELPFGRAVGESERAFGCFRAYLEVGEERMLPAVAEQAGVSLYTLKGWACRYRWNKRVDRYYEWAEENRMTEDGGPKTEDRQARSEVSGQRSEDGETGGKCRMTDDGRRRTEDRMERLAGERLRRAAERALERFGCEGQARKVGLGEIARTFATAFRLERPPADKTNGQDGNGLSAEEDAALNREFAAAINKIVETERKKRELEDRGPMTEDRRQTTEDVATEEVSGQRAEVRAEGIEGRGPKTEDRQQDRLAEAGTLTIGERKEGAPGIEVGAQGPEGPVAGGAAAAPVSLIELRRRQKPPQGTEARRRWVQRKYGVVV